MTRAWPVLSLFGAALAGCASGPHGTMHEDVALDTYSPLSRNVEILRRILTPLGFRHGQQALARKGGAVVEQAIDLPKERLAVYVPAGPQPPDGYGLLVFVSPVDRPIEPRRWRQTLDAHGVILVSAARSGNQSKVYERRVPLALLAYENVRARYAVDPRRVYVGGLSGGARVAEALALAYPDVFRGVLLNAGSQPIGGEHGMFLPPRDLFGAFQHTRVAYVTGAQDDTNLRDDDVSRRSLRGWCVLDMEVFVPPTLAHEILDAGSLDRVLTSFEGPSRLDPDALAACNAEVERTLAAKLADVEAAITSGDRDRARAQLDAVDRYFGGLAAPATLELEDRLVHPGGAP
jgi:hypothetical protein